MHQCTDVLVQHVGKRVRVIPVNRWPVKTLLTVKRWPYQVMTFVEWCGHQQEVVLVPEGDGWYSEIPVLGETS